MSSEHLQTFWENGGQAGSQTDIRLSGYPSGYPSLPFSKQHRAGQKTHCTRRQIAPGDNKVGNTPIYGEPWKKQRISWQ
jgi:hypothetical protein